MKKMLCALLALTLMLCTFAMAVTIVPQFTELDTTDATYPAAFSRNDLKDGTLNNVRLYTEDWYDIVDVEQMKVGDTFEAEGNTITVETIEKNQFGDIDINGGFEAENGYTLTTEEDTNGWTTTGYDDFCTYTQRDTVSLALAENITFNDSFFLDVEAIEAGREALSDSFNELNTKITFKDGKVVEITRRYIP